jgi:hypothetical protein
MRRVRLLPEWLLRFAEQVVQQRCYRVGDRVRIELVVQRVVADASIEPHLDVVGVSARPAEHGPDLAAEVTFDLQDEATNLPGRVVCLPAKELVHVRIHACGRLAGADRAQDHHPRVQASLRDGEPLGTRRRSWRRLIVLFAEDERRRGPLLGLRVRGQRPDARTGYVAIHDDRHQRHQQRHREVWRGEPQSGVSVGQDGKHSWCAFTDKAEEHIIGRNRVRAEPPETDAAGHRQRNHRARFNDLAQHGNTILLSARRR